MEENATDQPKKLIVVVMVSAHALALVDESVMGRKNVYRKVTFVMVIMIVETNMMNEIVQVVYSAQVKF
jgi:hypothetical protein